MTSVNVNAYTANSAQGWQRHQEFQAPAGLVARIAADPQTRADAFALRHISYLAGGHIDPRAGGMFSDPYDDQPHCNTIVVYSKQQAIASVRVCLLDTARHGICTNMLPAGSVFPEEVTALLNSAPGCDINPRAVEINRLVRHPDFLDNYKLVFVLFRLAGYMIIHHNADIVLSCVRQNHVAFYQKLKFETVAGPRTYHGVNFATRLMACFRAEYDNVRRSFPIVDVNPALQAVYDGLLEGRTVSVFEAPPVLA
jgi:hypothetical protein